MASGGRSRLTAALIAGAIAITINTALLAGADAIGFVTARGGLLRLVKQIMGDLAPLVDLSNLWSGVIAPPTSSAGFKTGFHVFVGIVMALLYAYVLETILPGRPLVKGLIYAAMVWLLNAFVVLPAIGEGIAGSARLGVDGILGFAAIHTVFFVLLALLYARFRGTPQHA
jgi:hypothetical protein